MNKETYEALKKVLDWVDGQRYENEIEKEFRQVCSWMKEKEKALQRRITTEIKP
jgi:hypothetical protein